MVFFEEFVVFFFINEIYIIYLIFFMLWFLGNVEVNGWIVCVFFFFGFRFLFLLVF